MPIFTSDSEMINHFGDVQFASLRLPHAFDQWFEAKGLIQKDNPSCRELSAVTDNILAGVSHDGRAVCFAVRVGDTWVTTNSGHTLRPSGRVILAALISAASEKGLSYGKA